MRPGVEDYQLDRQTNLPCRQQPSPQPPIQLPSCHEVGHHPPDFRTGVEGLQQEFCELGVKETSRQAGGVSELWMDFLTDLITISIGHVVVCVDERTCCNLAGTQRVENPFASQRIHEPRRVASQEPARAGKAIAFEIGTRQRRNRPRIGHESGAGCDG